MSKEECPHLVQEPNLSKLRSDLVDVLKSAHLLSNYNSTVLLKTLNI